MAVRTFKPFLYPLPLPSTRYRMKIILPDKSVRMLESGPVTAETLLRDLGLDPVEVMVVRNGTLVTEDAIAANDDEIRIIRIAHGG